MFCSFYKNNSQNTSEIDSFDKTNIPLDTMPIRVEALSCVMRVGPGIDTFFSHGSGTSTARVKITKLLQ